MRLAVFGASFRSAPIDLREGLSFNSSRVPEVLQRCREALPGTELVLLSTCNRTELYVAGAKPDLDRESVVTALLGEDAGASLAENAAHMYTKKGAEAAEHLLAVGASLDSMVVGETEILGQLKQAYTLANQAGTVGTVLNALFQHAFKTAKHVHSETDIGRGRVSVSSIAVEFAEKIFDKLAAKNIMIVGSGEMAELTLKSLVERPVRDVFILNRSLDRAERLAEQYAGKAIQFDHLADYLPKMDIVISSTACPHCVIHVDTVRKATQERRGSPLLLIDIAVPRDIEPEIGELKNVYLYHIDDLQKVAEKNLSRRQKAIGKAWDIVRKEAADAAQSLGAPDLGEIMREIDTRTEDVREAALKWALGKQNLSSLPDDAKDQVVRLAERITAKLLAPSKNALQKAARNGTWDEYSRVARDLLGIHRQEKAPQDEQPGLPSPAPTQQTNQPDHSEKPH